jgi:cell division protease FtsH
MTFIFASAVAAAAAYIAYRLFNWTASHSDPRVFIIRLSLFAVAVGTVIWALLDPEVMNIILAVLRLALQFLFIMFLAIGQFVAIFWFMSRSKVQVIRPGDPKQLTFADYKGQPNLLKLVNEWVSLLTDRSQFQKMGGQFINGLLLYGEPGTGKTHLAKCMAGEAGIAFISIEGSGFRAMFWGVDVMRMIWFVRKARNLAREYGACIAYIDEIDAVGMSRGGVMGGQGQMGMGLAGGFMGGYSGALTRLLYEMDGISEPSRLENLRARVYKLLRRPVPPRSWHMLFMGSTNRPDVLDPALTRPGRFDRMIKVDKPDRAGRREIINYYLKKVKYDESEVDIEAIVSDTAWSTPAEIMSAITKDAVRRALFDGRNRVNQRDIDLAFQEQAFGLENPIEEMQEDQRRQIAYHEAGHAVAQYYLRPDERIVRVTIIRRSGALGYMLPSPNYELYAYPLKVQVADIMVSLAGHVATKLFFGEYWSGASGDFQNIRGRIALLASLGQFGPPIVEPSSVLRGEFTGREKDIERFWKQAEEATERLLRLHAAEVDAVAQALLDRGDLSGTECVEIIQQAAPRDGHKEIAPAELEALPAQIVDEVTSRDGDGVGEAVPAAGETANEQPADK